jgi:hypothetical protein
VHRVAECPAVAEKHKLVANKFGKARKAHLTRAAMLSGSRPPGAQPSSAWKRTSYPALWSAMLRAFQAFYLDNRKLTSQEAAVVIRQGIRGENGDVVGQALRLPSPPGQAGAPALQFFGSNSATPGDRRLTSLFPSGAAATHPSTSWRWCGCRDRAFCRSSESQSRVRAGRALSRARGCLVRED